jgi:hypothetical protein
MIEFWEYNGNILQPKSNRSLRLTRLLVTIAAEYQVNPEYSSLKPTSFITKQHLIDNGGTISFSDIVAIFQEGTNINFTVDPVLETITINGSEMDNTVFDGDGTVLTPFTLKNFGDGKERVNKDGAWAEATGGGGGGHVIIDEAGNPMPQRENLQFTGAVEVTDDIVNDKTVVEVTGGSSGNKNLYSLYMLNNLGRTI